MKYLLQLQYDVCICVYKLLFILSISNEYTYIYTIEDQHHSTQSRL